jgi:hypothetical protein
MVGNSDEKYTSHAYCAAGLTEYNSKLMHFDLNLGFKEAVQSEKCSVESVMKNLFLLV